MTLGFAESCTGGLLSSMVTALPGSSKYFSGALVCYANQTKHDLLGVSNGDLYHHGAVSEPVARAMALGARKVLKVDWAVAITGISGPSGGTKSKPVGLVHVAVSGPKIVDHQLRIFKGTRRKIQSQAAEFALSLLLKNLNVKRRHHHGKRK
jgi:PncC family amidohydrolase